MTRMVRTMLSGLAVLLFFCFGLSSAAFAEGSEYSYRVAKGDYLEKIAKAHGTSWPVLAKLNKLKDPNVIVQGQVLILPKTAAVPQKVEATTASTSSPAAPCATAHDAPGFQWKNYGVDPLQDTPFSVALEMLCFPKHISDQFLEKVASGKFDETVGILPGDTFDAMTFGRGLVRGNVVASWSGQIIPARVYTITEGKTEYRLVYPLPCGNWAKQVRQLTPPTVPASPELAKQPKHPPVLPEIPVIWGGPCNCNERDTSWWKPPSEPYPEIYHGS